MNKKSTTSSIMTQPYPKSDASKIDPDAERGMAWLKAVVARIRRCRDAFNVPNHKNLSFAVIETHTNDAKRYFEQTKELIAHMCTITQILDPDVDEIPTDIKIYTLLLECRTRIYVPLEELCDPKIEANKLQKKIENTQTNISKLHEKLSNTQFLNKAPRDIVDKNELKLRELQAELTYLQNQLHYFTQNPKR